MAFIIKANGIALPSPTQITSGDEIIWSSSTGRSDNGKMMGDVIAEKQTLSIKWEFLTKNEKEIIKNNLQAGFFGVQLLFGDETVTLTTYRATITAEHLGYIGDGIYYFRSVSCDLTEQ